MSHDDHYQATRDFPAPWLPAPNLLLSSRFTLLQQLHCGAETELWTASDSAAASGSPAATVVIRCLSATQRPHPHCRTAFHNETLLQQRLTHPHLCPLLTSGLLPDGSPFQTLPYIKAGSLRDLLTQHPEGLSIAATERLLQPLAGVLDYLHSAGIVHCDLKPENLLLPESAPGPLLIDFGLASESPSTRPVPTSWPPTCRGTQAYMSPEHWTLQPLTAASDVWSLAVLTWEMLTGSAPACADGRPWGQSSARDAAPQLPHWLRHLQPAFAAAFQQDPRQRCQSASDFLTQFRRCRTTTSAIPPLLKVPFTATEATAARAAWASWLQVPEFLQPAPGWTFTLIPPGEFLQGSVDDDASLALAGLQLPAGHRLCDERPPRHVQLTKPWYLQTSYVSVSQFAEFIAATDYRTDCERTGGGGFGYESTSGLSEQQPRFSWRDPGFVQQPSHPAVNVSWYDCQKLCEWLSRRFSELPRQGRLRLPLESEFEYCVRAGSPSRFPTGQLLPPNFSTAQTAAAAVSPAELLTGRLLPNWFHAPVLLPWPNAFELQGLLGTVWHWCGDRFSPQTSGDQRRAQRGGSWALPAAQLRSSLRRGRPPEFCCHRSGVRTAIQLF